MRQVCSPPPTPRHLRGRHPARHVPGKQREGPSREEVQEDGGEPAVSGKLPLTPQVTWPPSFFGQMHRKPVRALGSSRSWVSVAFTEWMHFSGESSRDSRQ